MVSRVQQHTHSYEHLVLDPASLGVSSSWADPSAVEIPPQLLAALGEYLSAARGGGGDDEAAAAEADDEFMMYEFKVRRCARAEPRLDGVPLRAPGGGRAAPGPAPRRLHGGAVPGLPAPPGRRVPARRRLPLRARHLRAVAPPVPLPHPPLPRRHRLPTPRLLLRAHRGRAPRRRALQGRVLAALALGLAQVDPGAVLGVAAGVPRGGLPEVVRRRRRAVVGRRRRDGGADARNAGAQLQEGPGGGGGAGTAGPACGHGGGRAGLGVGVGARDVGVPGANCRALDVDAISVARSRRRQEAPIRNSFD